MITVQTVILSPYSLFLRIILLFFPCIFLMIFILRFKYITKSLRAIKIGGPQWFDSFRVLAKHQFWGFKRSFLKTPIFIVQVILSVLRASVLYFHRWPLGTPLQLPGGSDGKGFSCNAGNPGLIPGWKDPLEKGMATHSNPLAWRIPWAEEPGSLQSMGSQRVEEHNWMTNIPNPGTPSFLHLSQITKGKGEWQISCLLVTLIVTQEFSALFLSIFYYFHLCSYILPLSSTPLYISTCELFYTFKAKAGNQKLNSSTSFSSPT